MFDKGKAQKVWFLSCFAYAHGEMAYHEGKISMADVQQRLLCFEYLPKGSLHDYITDACGGYEWRERYNIIKGICEGLNYLHQNHIVHLDRQIYLWIIIWFLK